MNESSSWPVFQVDYITTVSFPVKVLLTVLYFTLFPLGNAMIYGIVRFECDGGDPQKRSTFNQLHSALFSSIEIYAPIGPSLMVIRAWVGPLGFTVGVTIMILRRFCLCFTGLLVINMLIIKILGLIKPKMVRRLRDNFWAFLIIMLSAIFALLVPMVDWYLYPTGQYPIIFVFISGQGDLRVAKEHKALWLSFIGIAFVLLAIYMTLRCFYPDSDGESAQSVPSQGFAYNNLRHNPAIIGNLQISFIVLILLAGAMPATILITKGPDFFILGSLLGALSTYFVVPLLLYVFNKKLRKYWFQKMMKNFATNQVSHGVTIAVIEPSTHNDRLEEMELTPTIDYLSH